VIQTSIEGAYVDGKPLHHLDSAKSPQYDQKASQFYVTTQEEFAKFKGPEIQEIFRHRHILIAGSPPDDFRFDRNGLKALGSLTARREIQGMVLPDMQETENINSYLSHAVSSKRNMQNPDDMLYFGTLQDLLKPQDELNGDSLNILDLPMGGAVIPPPPQYRYNVPTVCDGH
jgi:hypothetical protein